MAMTAEEMDQQIAEMDDEQIPVGEHELHGPGHFLGLYSAEHVSATEFIFGATFVILGAGIWDILIGLLIGNILAMLSFRILTAPIGTQARLSLYAYLQKLGGEVVAKLYNAANVIIFLVISAAMITVSATAMRRIFGFAPQTEAYPTSLGFIVITVAFAIVAVLVAAFGFNALAEFATICGPWLAVMFTTGGLVLLPSVAESVTGFTTIGSLGEFIQISGATIFTGLTPEGEPGIGLVEVIGFAWAANTLIHFGLIDMALFRYAKKGWYGYCSSTGMLFGHYVAWISAGFMGAATAAITLKSITVLAPGDVAFYALGIAGYATVIVSGWTTANPNLYRSGLAAQAVFPSVSRTKVTLIVGAFVVVLATFPFVYRNFLPLITYAGVALVGIGGVVFAEHFLFQRLGLTKFWAKYKGVQNYPAILAWGISLVFAVGLSLLNIIPYAFVFIPTWIVSIVAYILLAKWAGADQEYPEEEENEELFQERVKVYREEQAKDAPAHVSDTRLFTRVLKAIWIVTCFVILGYAFVVLFFSPDMYTYLTQRETFYTIAITGTVIYFVTAYWELRRQKAFAKQAASESAEDPQTDQAESSATAG